MKLLVSRCLLGEPCRYDGRSAPGEGVLRLREEGYTLIPVCPEVEGGLPTPRPPAEYQQNGCVVNREGVDVTAQYHAGAKIALERARCAGCSAAILKAKSPSCGNERIYDGTFSRTLIPGQGVTAALLTEAGIPVFNEEQLDRLKELD